MKLSLQASAITLCVLMAGCGGGGGGSSSAPVTPTPPITAPVVAGVASFSGSRSDYTITPVTSGYTVTDRRNNSVANVAGATALHFLDMTVNLAIGSKVIAFGSVKALIELYAACLNQLPDADGLSFWIDKIDPLKGGQTMLQIADSLYAQAILLPAVTGFSELMLNDEFVTAVYKNVFGRSGVTAPTLAEIQNWSSRIDKGGISRGALLLAMLESARSGSGDLAAGAVVQLLDNTLVVSEYFAVQQGINYNSADESLARRVAIAEAVTATDVTAAKGLIGFADASFNLLAGK